jgi:hypothetical protein
LPETCDGSEPLSPWGVGVSAGWFATEIEFDRGVEMSALTTMAQATYQPSARLGLGFGLGAVIGGTIADGDISPGPAASASATWLVSPYLAARVFAGPVGWTLDGGEQTGSDAHHYTVGAGLVVRAGRRLDLSAEGMALGEVSATAALSLSL